MDPNTFRTEIFRLRDAEMREESPAIEEAYTRLFQGLPQDARLQAAAGQLALQVGRSAEAVLCLETAARLAPRDPAHHFALGQALYVMRRPERAMTAIGRALDLVPGDPDGLHNLGLCLVSLGRIEEARAHFVRAIDVSPRHMASLSSLAQIHKFVDGDWLLARLEDIERRPVGVSAQGLVRLHYTLGRARDEMKAWDKAIASVREATGLQRALAGYDEAADRRAFDIAAAQFSRAARAEAADPAPGDPTIVFVLGMPRSGTTLLEQMLASHPGAEGLGEVPFLLETYTRWQLGAFSGGRRDEDALMSRTAFISARRAYLRRAAARSLKDARVLIDKTPTNFLAVGLIAKAFPDAVILRTSRDALDTCWSCYSNQFLAGQPWSCDEGELARFFNRYARLMAAFDTAFPGRALDIPYEELTAAPEAHLRAALAAAGLSWREEVLAFERASSPVITASFAQVRRPLYRSSVRRSDPYRPHLARLIAGLESGET